MRPATDIQIARASGAPRSRSQGWLFLLVGALYLLLPADLVPDLLPGIGFADDFVVLLASALLSRAFGKEKNSPS